MVQGPDTARSNRAEERDGEQGRGIESKTPRPGVRGPIRAHSNDAVDEPQRCERQACGDEQRGEAKGERSEQAQRRHASAPCCEEKQQQCDRSQHDAGFGRPVQPVPLAEVGIDLVRCGRRKVGIHECPQQRKRVFAVVLQRAEVEIGDRIERRVIVVAFAGEREVNAGQPRTQRHREVGVVGHALEDLLGERLRKGMRGDVAERGHQFAARRPGTQQVHRPRRSGTLEVDHCPGTFRGRTLREESLRTEQARFLGVGERHQDRVSIRRARLDDARHLEQRSNGSTIVPGAGCVRHRIVVRHQHDGVGSFPGYRGQHVFDPGAGGALGGAADGSLLLVPEAKLGEPRDQPLLDGAIGRGADRMRRFVTQEVRQLVAGATGREDTPICVDPKRVGRRGLSELDSEHDGEQRECCWQRPVTLGPSHVASACIMHFPRRTRDPSAARADRAGPSFAARRKIADYSECRAWARPSAAAAGRAA